MQDAAGTESGLPGREQATTPAGQPGRAGHADAVPPHPVRADLPWLVEKGLLMVAERRAGGGFELYESIQRQLEYLREVIASGQPPPEDKLDSLTLGVYAAREFETSDPDLADVLFAVSYLANRMS